MSPPPCPGHRGRHPAGRQGRKEPGQDMVRRNLKGRRNPRRSILCPGSSARARSPGRTCTRARLAAVMSDMPRPRPPHLVRQTKQTWQAGLVCPARPRPARQAQERVRDARVRGRVSRPSAARPPASRARPALARCSWLWGQTPEFDGIGRRSPARPTPAPQHHVARTGRRRHAARRNPRAKSLTAVSAERHAEPGEQFPQHDALTVHMGEGCRTGHNRSDPGCQER